MEIKLNKFDVLFISSLFCLTLMLSCSVKNDDYKEITYQELPSDVRKKFKEVYGYKEPPKIINGKRVTYMPPFVECYNVDQNCTCRIKSKGGIIRDPYFVITSCKKTAKMSWAILQRVFIIKNDSIYYPWSNDGVTTSGEARSFDVLIDTLKFRVEKMR
ncbi:hypothetical protein [Parabacteroides sp. FAFU027]|uniref:hypothetical protein n=1 Tax=Parabacteroides sp. FAFU027 TaxID=2922715 RepID=UPI001FAFEDC6|nr:hypothetical protein [Parabacteroides sp. FAFU027]